MNRPYDYKQYKIETIQDIDILIGLIHKYGHFTNKDFSYLFKQALNSETPQRIIIRLNRKVKSLIVDAKKINRGKKTVEIEKDINTESHIYRNDLDIGIFEKTYKASDFIFEDGVIKIGDWSLKSKRVIEVHPSILQDIVHPFKIASESLKNKRFHFVPYTDLSVILDAIEIQKKKIEYLKLKSDFERSYAIISQRMRSHVETYISKKYFITPNLEYRALTLHNLMYKYGLITYRKEEFIPLVQECNLRVPLKNLNIYDGYVEVSLEGVEYDITDCECFEWAISDSLIQKYFRNFEKEIEAIYYECIRQIQMKCQILYTGTIKINTYISRRCFEDIFSHSIDELLRFSNWPSKDKEYIVCSSERMVLCEKIDQNRYFYFPDCFVKQRENEGFSLLCLADYNSLQQMLFSEIYKFPVDAEIFIQQRAKLSDSLNDNERLRDVLLAPLCQDVRIITDYYINRHDIQDQDLKTNNGNSILLEFRENFAHFSDERFWEREINKSYLLIDHVEDRIVLVSTNQKYAKYVFYFNAKRVAMESVALVLVKYFQSEIRNKRQIFWIYNFLVELGLTKFLRISQKRESSNLFKIFL